MRKMILATLLLMIWGCGDAAPDAAQTETTMPPAQSTEAAPAASTDDAATGDRAKSEFIPQDIDQISSPFTRETVIRLNAIVQRSLDIIEEFDDNIPDIRDAVTLFSEDKMAENTRSEADKAMAILADMHERSKAAQADIKKAEVEVMASGEVYNDAILAAMVGFVDDVELELADEIDELSKKLADG